ncbi:MAG: NAD(+) diphosphatase [Rhodoluna sp.]
MHEPLSLPLARSAVDRDNTLRSRPNLLGELWQDPATRVLVLESGQTLLAGSTGQHGPALNLLSVDKCQQLRNMGSILTEAYLGFSVDAQGDVPAGTRILLAVVDIAGATELEPDVDAWVGLRRTGAGLSARDAGLYAEALSLANWHQSHLYCPRCGEATESSEAGWVRICPIDQHQIFPRTDPAIIVSVIDDQDRILLGSQGVWEENRWSILAGFVEPGESLAAAVQREVYEESGIRVIEPEYLGSQAWPFPYSLMVGFTARVDPAHADLPLNPDGVEIEKLRWFSREEIAAEAGHLLLPGKLSIAGALIERWYGGPIGS